MNSDLWYFAYGSNLLVAQMVARTSPIRQAVRCRLIDYRLLFNKRGSEGQIFANIAPDRGSEVWGVAYLCQPADLEKMDIHEGVAEGHYRRLSVLVKTDAKEQLAAIAYIAEGGSLCPPGRPRDDYLGKVLAGARHHALPAEYIRQIQRLAGKIA